MAEVLFKNSWLNLVFETKNKSYGAFLLRQRYAKHVLFALLVSSSVFILSISSPLIIKNLFPEKKEVKKKKKKREQLLVMDVPPPSETPELPPPPPVEPPKIEMKTFLPPVPVPSNEADAEIHDNKELEETNVGDKDQEGVKDFTGAFETVPEPTKEEEVVQIEEEFDISNVDEVPDFPGGMAELGKFLGKNISYPQQAANIGIQGKVLVQFLVSSDGSVSEFKAVSKPIGGGLEEEALRVAKTMPKWIPAKTNGKSVRCRMIIPITFKLDQ